MVDITMNKYHPDSPLGLAHSDAALDEALAESFPASDPIAISFPRAVGLAGQERDIAPNWTSARKHRLGPRIKRMPP
jgi:hypothetical protein